MKTSLRLSFVLFFALQTLFTYAQISKGGTPFSFSADLIGEYEVLTYNQPDMEEVIFQDQLNDADPARPQRAAVPVYLNIDAMEHGTWTESAGKKIWRLGIRVPEARALALYYNRFWLPDQGELFLYNENKKQVIGAFTSENNHPDGLFATELIQGELVTLEYVQPSNVSVLPSIELSEVAFGYRFVEMPQFMDDQTRDPSWWCMINVNCPEGDDWQMQKKGVVRQWMKLPGGYYGWCSGSLLNNTSWDLTPYVLTAGHCGEGCTASDLNQWIFYFNYESATCSGSTGPETQTMTGCYKRAADESAGDTGSDFYLVELKQSVPTSYSPFFNGWDATGTGSTSGVSIHHPNGDIKKISTYTQSLQTSTWWNGLPSHWTFNWAATVSGLSIVQGGSSGSPLFNASGLVIGDLTGGYQSNSCENPSPVWYGKFSYSWDQNGSTPEVRLKDWLDPTNTGELVIIGTDGNVPQADFTADPQGVSPGGTIQFTDISMGNPESWSWTFQGGSPSTSTEQHPQVTYSNYGSFDVTLTITNIFGSDTETKTDFIIVGDLPVADFSSDVTTVTQGGQVDFQNLSTGDIISSYWQFPGGSPPQSHNSNPPMIVYETPGSYNVKLTVTNAYGQDVELKENYITVLGAPVPDFTVDTAKTLEGGAIQFTDASSGAPENWNWSFEGGVPATSTDQNPLVVYPTAGAYDVILEVSGAGGTADTTKTEFITVIAPVIAGFSADSTVLPVNGTVQFTDESTGDPQAWMWQFEGGFPDQWEEQTPPEITYFNPGIFTVTLTVTGIYNDDTEVKTGFIDIGLAPEAAFESSTFFIPVGEEIDFIDLSANSPIAWLWTFENGTPPTSNVQHPLGITWLQSGTYDVTLQVSNPYGTDEHIIQDMIHVSGVGIEEAGSVLSVFPNPSDGNFSVDLTGLAIQGRQIEILAPNGKVLFHQEMVPGKTQYSIHLPQAIVGIYTLKVASDEQVIVRKIQIVK
ncbi:MAG: PKD domain-containing protein [Bacteroidia bacterium]|nr:PKD domain-containing protein [Bacteroidales bacterium]NCD41895.1 PKD domain-containing protein [Bacteroidia bacterium]MDD2323527.1 PKD domain-containing protein [Bacteroidales bacterium]MDD3010652.1 PKD domain-containing protein [Bacteroidales bacterium]MDD3960983.1 PKD domain-containing protein [Bacteroidales bacterium]